MPKTFQLVNDSDPLSDNENLEDGLHLSNSIIEQEQNGSQEESES